MTSQEFRVEIQNLISQNESIEAVLTLKRLANDVGNKKLLNEIIIQQGRLKENERNKRLDILTEDSYKIELHKINSSLLAVLDDIAEIENLPQRKLKKYFTEIKTFPRSYFYLFLTVALCIFVISFIQVSNRFSGLNIDVKKLPEKEEQINSLSEELDSFKENTRLMKLVVSMDSPNITKDNVYDPRSQREGKTNSDDIGVALSELSNVLFMKEITGKNWTRGEQIRKFNPDLIVIHYSCFYSNTSNDTLDKFEGFLSKVSHIDSKLLIYSRNEADTFQVAALFEEWKRKKVTKYPLLKDRLFFFQ